MSNKTPTNNELLIRLDERSTEMLRRMDNFDQNFVPKNEINQALNELRQKHQANQQNIEQVQDDLKGLMYKLGVSLGGLQVISSLTIFLITKG